MLDIAKATNISKVTLYRYFPDRDPIAFEVAVNMIKHIFHTATENQTENALWDVLLRMMCLNMIDHFDVLIPAYRYIGMFDHLYAQAYPTENLQNWYKEQLFGSNAFTQTIFDLEQLTPEQLAISITIINTIMSFLEKMVARGELMGKEQGVPRATQLQTFRQFIMTYFDTISIEDSHV